MNSINKIFHRNRTNSKEVAKNRLQLVLVHDRINLSPGKMEKLKEEIAQVLSRYVEIDHERIDIAVTDSHRQRQLTAQVPVLGVAH